jgi:hypothetical protein
VTLEGQSVEAPRAARQSNMIMSTVGLETRIAVLARASSNITASVVSGEWLVSEIVGGLLRFSRCELLL